MEMCYNKYNGALYLETEGPNRDFADIRFRCAVSCISHKQLKVSSAELQISSIS